MSLATHSGGYYPEIVAEEISRLDRILQWTVVAVLAAIYFFTLSPFLPAGDSGELIVVADKLALAHPPGYPIYTYLAHLFSLIPYSTMAWRIGFFSLVCQLIASSLFFKLALEWLGQAWLAAILTVLYSLAPLTWQHATEAEVFALNSLFAILTLWLLYRFHTQRRFKYAYLACLVMGLGACNHLTLLMMAFPIVAGLFWLHRRGLWQVKVILLCLSSFAIGLLPYLLIIPLGRVRHLSAWGDVSTWDGFFTHVLRREYGTFQLAVGGLQDSSLFSKLYYFDLELARQLSFALAPLVVWGMFHARARGGKPATVFARLLAAALVFYAVVFHSLSNLDLSVPLYHYAQSRMWTLPLMLAFLLVGWGVEGWAAKKSTRPFVMTGLFAAIGISVFLQWRKVTSASKDFIERAGHTILDNVEPGAVILMREDVYVNATRYLQYEMGVRPDVRVIPMDSLGWPWMRGLVAAGAPEVKLPEGPLTMRQVLDANIGRVPLYIAKLKTEEELSLRGFYSGFPLGFTSRVKIAGSEFTIAELKRESLPFLQLTLPEPGTYREASWEAYMYKNYFDVRIPMGQLLLRKAAGRLDWIDFSIDVLRGAANMGGEYRGEALASLGAAYLELAPANPQYRKSALDVWQEYLAGNPAENDQVRSIRALVLQMQAGK